MWSATGVGNDNRMHLDHLSYAAGREGLASCVQRIGTRLGGIFHDGGMHPAFGTRNFVLGMNNGCYIEVLGAIDHPALDRVPFGRAVRELSESGGGWLSWAVRVSDIAVVESRLRRPALEAHRRRPDGVDLRWRQVGIDSLTVDSQFPFFVQWEGDRGHHPSNDGSTITLLSLELAGEQSDLDDYLGVSSTQQLEGIQVVWEPAGDDDAGLIAAVFGTPNGLVRID